MLIEVSDKSTDMIRRWTSKANEFNQHVLKYFLDVHVDDQVRLQNGEDTLQFGQYTTWTVSVSYKILSISKQDEDLEMHLWIEIFQ